MLFITTTPENEEDILILVENADTRYMIQGNYFFDDDGDFYDWDGELLYGVIGWTDLPTIDLG